MSDEPAEVFDEVVAAEERIRPHLPVTDLIPAPYLAGPGDAEVSVKLECRQRTGSFKVRGAMSKILALTDDERSRGVVAASSGNHGAAVAYTVGKLGATGTIFVPAGIEPTKRQVIESLGAQVRTVPGDPVEAERAARRHAEVHHQVYVSPYNDPQVVGGQGTVAAEIHRQLDRFDTVIAALGGGGLLSGIAAYLQRMRPEVEVIGCSPERSPVMIRSVAAGRIRKLPSLPTLSDGTAGGVEEDAITFELCRRLVQRYETVTEDEIADALVRFVEAHDEPIEGAAGVALATYEKLRPRLRGRRVVVVICGGNIAPETLAALRAARRA